MKPTALQLDQKRLRPGSFRELLWVSIPLVISSGTNGLMYVVDRVFLSWDSVDSMAAALPAGVLHWNLAALALGTVGYANAFVGQYEGAGDRHRIGPVLWQGVYIALVATAIIWICVLPFAPQIFSFFGHDSVIQALELRYFRIMCWGTAPLLVSATLACFYSGRGQTTVIMVVDIIGSLVNVVLDYLLIFGKFGFPKLGIDGAAIATATAFTSIVVMYLIVLAWTQRGSEYCLFSGWRFDRQLSARFLRFGLPNGIQQFLDIACWTFFVQVVGGLGRTELAATGLLFNLNSLVFIPLMGISTAVMALTGQRVGEGRPELAVRTTWMAVGLASIYVFIWCGIYLLLPEFILRPYGLTENEGPLEQLVIFLLRFVAVYSLFDAMAVIFGSAIRGAGDTRFSLIFSVSAGVLVMVIPSYIASREGPAGFLLAWYAVTAFVTVLGLGFLARFQQGRWKKMRVIEHTAPELGHLPPIEAAAQAVSVSTSS